MSKLKLNKINFDESDFLVEVTKEKTKETKTDKPSQVDIEMQKKAQDLYTEAKLILNRAKDEAQQIVDNANKEALEIKEKNEEEILKRKEEIIEQATQRADEIIENAQKKSQEDTQNLINSSKENIEQERIETIKNAYEEGHREGLEHIQEELEEKIADFNNFCKNQYEVRDKILKSANKDILDLVINISRKILLKEIDFAVLDKIIKSTISLLEKKENISIILSEKYAKLLYEHQKKSLAQDIEFNFEDFKQYDNFNIVYNPSFDEDTIIVENLKERYDASVNSQLDVIIRNIYDNSQNGKLDLEQYTQDEAEWTWKNR